MNAPEPGKDLSRLLSPAAIALVGASSNPQVTSGQPLRYMREFGYTGRMYPVNPKREQVQGLRCYGSVLAIPEACDVAVITVAAAHVPGTLRACGIAKIPFAVVLSAGFEAASEADTRLRDELRQAIVDSGVRVVGPNSTGVVNLNCRSYCAQGGALSDPTLRPGPVAVVSQSGGVGLSMLSFIQSAGIGTSYLLSSGNELDLDVFDFADHLLDAQDVSTIALYLESTTRGHKLRALGRRALALGKPIVVLKAGNAGAARNAAASHTGRLTADYELFRAAFREGGYVEVGDIDELVDMVKALNCRMRPRGNRSAILTTSGGWGVMMAERFEQHGLTLPELSPATLNSVRELVPSYASLANPVDITPQGYKDQYASYNEITRLLLADPGIDLVVVRSATGSDMRVWAERLIPIAEGCDKPVVVHWAPSGQRYHDVRELLERHGIPCFSFVNQVARIVAASVAFTQKQSRGQPVLQAPVPEPASMRPALALRNSPGNMGEFSAVECLRAYAIPVARGRLFKLDEVDEIELHDLRFPVAVKVESADIPHKTDAGGVALNVREVSEVRNAARRILARVRAAAPDAAVNGILVQEMASGVETIVGAVSDPDFGPLVMLGMGGVFAETIRDVTYRFAPVTTADAMSMMKEIKGLLMLEDNRGQPRRDIEALADAIVNLSRLIWDYRHEIAEIEINPLFVRASGEGITAADCLIRVR